MSSPEVERRLRQQGADVDGLYEISARIEGKVDELAQSTNARFDALEQRTDARFDAQEARFDRLEQVLGQILERLDRD